MKNNLLTLDFDKVKIAMATNRYDVKTFCEKANIFDGTYRRISKGQAVSTSTVGKVAKALNVKVEDLL